jgi:hypothetical protein
VQQNAARDDDLPSSAQIEASYLPPVHDVKQADRMFM